MKQQHKQIALDFVQNLLDKKFDDAYSYLSDEGQSETTISALKSDFQDMMDPDKFQQTGAINVDEKSGLSDASQYSSKKPGDKTFVYVVIPGEKWSEGVSMIVNVDGKIRSVEVGRF